MIRIKFNNQKSTKNVEFDMPDENTVKLTGDKLKPNTSGFIAYRLNGDVLGDYSDFRDVLSCDGKTMYLSDL